MLPRLKTVKEREVKEQKTKRLFSILVISILALSVVAFALISYSPQSELGEEMYNNYIFTREREGWQTEVNNFYLLTIYLPQEVESISHSGTLGLEDFQNVVYFVAKTENERKAANELDRLLLALKKEIACLPQDANESACINMSIKSCNDASFIQKIIVFEEIEEVEEVNETFIDYKNNCLTIKGDSINLIRAIDKVIFLLFGVIKQGG